MELCETYCTNNNLLLPAGRYKMLNINKLIFRNVF